MDMFLVFGTTFVSIAKRWGFAEDGEVGRGFDHNAHADSERGGGVVEVQN